MGTREIEEAAAPARRIMSQWTAAHVEVRIEDAMRALARLPAGEWRHLRAGSVAVWPTIIRDAAEAYGYEPARGTKPRASSMDISRLDEVIDWFPRYLSLPECDKHGLAPDTAWVLGARAVMSWRRLQALRQDRWEGRSARKGRIPRGNSLPSLRAIHAAGIERLVHGLSRDGAPT